LYVNSPPLVQGGSITVPGPGPHAWQRKLRMPGGWVATVAVTCRLPGGSAPREATTAGWLVLRPGLILSPHCLRSRRLGLGYGD
jgi:hypothetical protein